MNKKSFIVTALSALVQYYEYHLFGFLAASIAHNFFPSSNTTVALMNTYFMMFIAVCGKPIGSIILGRIGDIYGRQTTINLSIIITTIASLVIGLLPKFNKIGIVSYFILLFARICTAAFASSGSDGVRLYIYEKISPTRKNLSSGISSAFSISGSLLASISAWFFTLKTMPEYYWRFAFLSGTAAGIILLILRKIYIDKYDDLLLKEEVNYDLYKEMPLLKIMQENALVLLLCIITAGGIGASYSFNFVFLSAYNSEILKIANQSEMQFYRSIGIFLYMIFACLGGIFADKFSPRISASIASMALIISILFGCHFSEKQIFIPALYLLNSALLPMLTIPCLTLLKSSVPKVVRYRLFSISHALGSIIISAPTAFLVTTLYHYFGIKYLPQLYFALIIAIMLISMNALVMLKKKQD